MAVKNLSNSSILQPASVNSMLGDYESNYFHHLETIRCATNISQFIFYNVDRYRDYQHLQIRAVTRNTSTAGGSTVNYGANGAIIFNNDTNDSYRTHYLQGNGSSLASGDYLSNSVAYIPDLGGVWDTHTADAFAVTTIDILDAFDTTKFKTLRAVSAFSTGGRRVILSSASWRSTSAITRIQITQDGNAFKLGSRFSLYGIKAGS